MAGITAPWVNVLAATVAGVVFGLGLGSLYNGFNLGGLFWAVLGFLVVGWAIFDRRRFRRGGTHCRAQTGPMRRVAVAGRANHANCVRKSRKRRLEPRRDQRLRASQ